MGDGLRFDYYYGIEAEQFSFYRVPRLLIKDERFKELSSDAKLLYGLMLDRMALSIKNGWFDEENRAYIHYTLDNIMEDLGCAREKCSKVIAELDSKKGIGLIEKKRQGLGKPDIIYVKNFATLEARTEPEKQPKSPANTDVSTEVRKPNFKRTIKKAEVVTSVDTASEALAVSLGEKARVDLGFMAELTGKSEEEVTAELAGVIFQNPVTEKWETADEYLSGNVREKLQIARVFAENHPEFAINIIRQPLAV